MEQKNQKIKRPDHEKHKKFKRKQKQKHKKNTDYDILIRKGTKTSKVTLKRKLLS